MKEKIIVISTFLITLFCPVRTIANSYTVKVGETLTIYCTASDPANGWIDACYWSYYDPNDQSYVSINYNARDLSCNLRGLSPKANIKIKVTYAYTYVGTYDNQRHVGSASYTDYVTVVSGVTPTAVDISPSSQTIIVGKSLTLTASVTPSNAYTTYTWGLLNGFGNPYNFTLSPNGNECTITANGPGDAYVVVQTSNGLSATSVITAQTAEVTEVHIRPYSSDSWVDRDGYYALVIGNSGALLYETTPKPTSSSLSWNVNDPSIIEITTTMQTVAFLKAKKLGMTYVTVNADNGVSDTIILAAVNPVEATDITFAQDTLTMKVGDSHNFLAIMTPEDATTPAKWKSSDNTVLEHHGIFGNFTAISVGSAIITATTKTDLQASCVVTVVKRDETELPSTHNTRCPHKIIKNNMIIIVSADGKQYDILGRPLLE